MKYQTQKALAALCLIPSLFILGNGCGDKNDSSTMGTNSPATNADNSGINARDKSPNAITAGDQGNSEPDRKITQAIRQQVVSETNHFSVTAKNVKIITMNGKVTLRGPVSDESEKTGIEGIAKAVAGEGNVDNQIEVKANANP